MTTSGFARELGTIAGHPPRFWSNNLGPHGGRVAAARAAAAHAGVASRSRTGRAVADGIATSLPDPPDVDETGRHVAIWA